jgi:predicted transcriptional regulator
MRVDLPDELAERVNLAASARGVTAEVIVAEAVAQVLPNPALPVDGPRRRLALAGIGKSESGLSHRIDEMLAEGFGRD